MNEYSGINDSVERSHAPLRASAAKRPAFRFSFFTPWLAARRNLSEAGRVGRAGALAPWMAPP
ncbi:hypothetical protein JY502_11385, partial [Stenotrophomonas maltophilia]|nr:hypothetical protein [Stenotrophomonas maltophilia]